MLIIQLNILVWNLSTVLIVIEQKKTFLYHSLYSLVNFTKFLIDAKKFLLS